MRGYRQYWLRGWWAFLLHVAVSVVSVLAIKVLDAIGLDKEGLAYNALMFAVFLVVLIPLTGLLFEYFAARSRRLLSTSDAS